MRVAKLMKVCLFVDFELSRGRRTRVFVGCSTGQRFGQRFAPARKIGQSMLSMSDKEQRGK